MLLEHPWSSDLWKYPPIQKLLQSGLLKLQKADMCAYELQDAESQQPILKPTGLAVSHDDMTPLALTCPGHASHQLIAGHTSDGVNRSTRAAEYTSVFVKTWLTCIRPQLCHFSCAQDSQQSECHSVMRDAHEVCAATEAKQIELLVRKLHNNLGHPSTRSLTRVLKNAGAHEMALKAAEAVESQCDICQQRQRPTPCLPANPEPAQDFNHKIGWDTKLMPGWKVNQQVKCMNIVDFATSFQVVVPLFEQETSDVLKRIFLESWQRWAGSPIEVLVDPAKTNTAEEVFERLEQDGIRISTIAAEAHNQLGKVEKHGHLFEVILQKVIDQVQPKNRAEYEQCVVQTCNAKNELLNQKGLSPCQLVFGRNPRVAGDLLQEQPCPVAATTPLHDEIAERARAIRAQARMALVMSQDDSALRTALNARPRAERDFLPGDFAQKYQKGVRLVGGRWYAVAIVMGKIGRNFVIFHRKNIFKVAPEHLRHASDEERMLAQADGREMLGLSSLLQDTERKQLGSQFTDLTNTPIPEQARAPVPETDDFWLKKGEYMCRIHRQPRNSLFWPSETDPALEGIWLDNWRKTIRSDTKECIVQQPLSHPECQHASWGEELWKGESQFRIRTRRSVPEGGRAEPLSSSMAGSTESANPLIGNETTPGENKGETHQTTTGEPYARPVAEPYWQTSGYGPVR